VTECEYCRLPIRPDDGNVVRKVSCWAENSKTGKPTKIIADTVVDFQLYLHRHCLDSYLRGGSVNEQTTMF
jgi:hypothetical protein